jgi:putative transcription factor
VNCEMCGKQTDLVLAKIENANMNVCKQCAMSGMKINLPKMKKKVFTNSETEEVIVNNYHILIRNAREGRSLKQEEAAKKLALKESMVHKLENGSFTPSLDIARKLERFYGIKLIETVEAANYSLTSSDEGEFTISDMIKG